MAQHQCVFDATLLGETKLPPHDACRCDRADDGPNIYTLHWYRRLCCVIQQGGQVLVLHPRTQLHCANLTEAMPSLVWLLSDADAVSSTDSVTAVTQ